MLLLPTLLLSSCQPAATAPPAAAGWPDGTPARITVDGQVLIEGAFGAVPAAWFALDTGADRLYVDDALAPDGPVDLALGPVLLPDVHLRATSLAAAEAAIGWDLGGLAGQPLFEGRVTAFDYASSVVHFFDERPDSPDDPEVLPYTIVEGVPVVSLDLGGGPLALLADTGSGVTLLDESAFAALDTGGPRLGGYVWATSYGSDEGFVARLPDGTWTVVVPDDNHLLPLLARVGLQIDGFLGYPWYRERLLGVDGLAQAYLSWPATGGATDPHEWHRVGVEVEQDGDGARVSMVFSPSAAEGVLAVGDRILAVDGVDAADLTLDEVKRALRGEPGGTVTITTERGDVTVEREDLLP